MVLFCPICKGIMKLYTYDVIKYICSGCSQELESKPEDTLIYEVNLETTESIIKYNDIINQIHSDPASFRVMQPCKTLDCGMPFVNMIRLGSAQNVIYVCGECKKKFTHEELYG